MMKTFAPLLHSYWYLFRGAGMTLLMAGASVVPATLLGLGWRWRRSSAAGRHGGR